MAAGLSTCPSRAQEQAPRWTVAAATDLLDAIAAARAEGLDPRDYEPEELRRAIGSGAGPALDAVASGRFIHLARDYTQGHVGPEDRLSWFIVGPALSKAAGEALMQRALGGERIRPLLAELLPSDQRYVRLRAALAKTSAGDAKRLQAIRVNMERWRWLPRALGARRLETNVPSYSVTFYDEGRAVAMHRVITGKPSTPTPQFSATVTGMIVNPWWEVPKSIVAESIGKLIRTQPATARARGYVWANGAVRQRPGPTNSLGQIKLVMPNPFSIYLHDTPSKALFQRPVRALSHGCVRTENPFDLAALLLAGQAGQSRADLDRLLASGQTEKIDLAAPLPVYVVYFTAEADGGGKLLTYPDIYGRDDVVAAELVDRGALDFAG
nr:L,D-transpeptidase family protein [Sphingomonas sp. ID1715]